MFSAFVGVVFGLAPAVKASRLDPAKLGKFVNPLPRPQPLVPDTASLPGSEVYEVKVQQAEADVGLRDGAGQELLDPVTKRPLRTRVWGYSANINTRTVDTHVLTVRKKLGDDANSPRFIQTLHGVGYQFIGREG